MARQKLIVSVTNREAVHEEAVDSEASKKSKVQKWLDNLGSDTTQGEYWNKTTSIFGSHNLGFYLPPPFS
jgi:hypothetical protein